MKTAVFGLILGIVLGQQRQCVYTDGRYTLNLTRESEWTLEIETPNIFLYYTPCRNGIRCYQGNAEYYANIAEIAPGANQCVHYLGVDRHQNPEYSFYGASWRFEYTDGEVCDITQQPRRTTIYYHCNEEENRPLELYGANEPQPCNYVLDVRGNQACVPENSHNANCQWRTRQNNVTYSLDLSALKNASIYSRLPNGYYHYVTPCRNGIYCYQQYNKPVMGVIENHETGTCEHYGAIWEDGRVQPILHNVGTPSEHWSFHYWNGQTCANGVLGEEELRFFCDPTADPFKVLNTTQPSPCRFDIDIATKYACTSQSKNPRPWDMVTKNGHKIGGKIMKKVLDRLNHH